MRRKKESVIGNLDGYETEVQSIQEKFEDLITNGLSDEFMEFYEKHRASDTKIDRYSFKVFGPTDSDKIFPMLKQFVINGEVKLILDQGRVDMSFFYDGTTDRVDDEFSYYRVYVYILKFCELSVNELIYLFNLSVAKPGAFFWLGMGRVKEFLNAAKTNKYLTEEDIQALVLWVEVNGGDIDEDYTAIFKKEK